MLVDAVHAGGAKIGIELHHAGRNTSSAISGSPPVAPSPVPCPEAGGEVPRALTYGEIDEIIGRYSLAAARAAAAGFDAVELHSAHGYLPLAFLSPLTNFRTDAYGGSFANRARFALEVISAIRSAVGVRVAVGCRFSAEEYLPGGLTLEETIAYARALEGAGVDYLSVTGGVYASFTRIIPPMDYAHGWLLPTAAAIKASVGVPVIGVSRIVDPQLADAAIAARVGVRRPGRALLTDPELPRKAQQGRVDEIVSCIGCNQGCEARISRQRDVTCLVNPAVGREPEFARTAAAPPRKRVVVVGGGPAGLEAARTCAERGHDVILYERSDRLGGMINFAAQYCPTAMVGRPLSSRPSAACVVAASSCVWARTPTTSCWQRPERTRSCSRPGPKFATIPRELPTDGSIPVLTPTELLGHGGSVPDRVVVAGAGAIGLGVAAWLVAREAQVTVVSGRPVIRIPTGRGVWCNGCSNRGV